MDLSSYKTNELPRVADLDAYAVRDEAERRSDGLLKRIARKNAEIEAMHKELNDCSAAIAAAWAEIHK